MVVGIPGNQLGGGKMLSAILLPEGRNPIFVPHVWGTYTKHTYNIYIQHIQTYIKHVQNMYKTYTKHIQKQLRNRAHNLRNSSQQLYIFIKKTV